MKLIDTHTHLYLADFDADRDEMIKRAIDCGVIKLLLPNIDVHSVDQMISAVSTLSRDLLPYGRSSSYICKRRLH